jgi:hypothetical protein
MHIPTNALSLQHVGRVQIALEAFKGGKFRSHRARGIPLRAEALPNGRKLTSTEEETTVQYILDLDVRGFAPHLSEVADMADKLLGERGGEPVGKCWASRFVTRSSGLKMAFNRAKDRQRILQQDPEVIGAWLSWWRRR